MLGAVIIGILVLLRPYQSSESDDVAWTIDGFAAAITEELGGENIGEDGAVAEENKLVNNFRRVLRF